MKRFYVPSPASGYGNPGCDFATIEEATEHAMSWLGVEDEYGPIGEVKIYEVQLAKTVTAPALKKKRSI